MGYDSEFDKEYIKDEKKLKRLERQFMMEERLSRQFVLKSKILFWISIIGLAGCWIYNMPELSMLFLGMFAGVAVSTFTK
jgi:hypothetical protein